eukprot:765906-Hanusia_phi.AAC.3
MPPPVLSYGFGMSAKLASFKPACEYLDIRSLAFPAILGQNVIIGTCLGIKDTRTPMIGIIVSSLTNIALDALLVSSWGMP